MGNCNNSYKPKGFDETLFTSDVSIYDGNALQCVDITGSSSLNQVIAAIDKAICSSLSTVPSHVHDAADVTYSGTLVYSCLTLTATNVEKAIEELATEICNLSTTVSGLCTDDIVLCNIDFACLLGGTYYPNPIPTTVTGFEHWAITVFCDIQDKLYGGGMAGVGYANRAEVVLGSDTQGLTNRVN